MPRACALIARLAAVIDDPGLGIALDPRGIDDERRAWQMLRANPAGKTTSHVAPAERLERAGGDSGDCREGHRPRNPLPRGGEKHGSISGHHSPVPRKRGLLDRERQARALSAGLNHDAGRRR